MTEKSTQRARLVGLCYPIRDIVVACTADVDGRIEIPEGVIFTDRDEFAEALELLRHRVPDALSWGAGGPISNSLYSAGMSLGSYPRPADLVWSGPIGPVVGDFVYGDPLSSLRSAGVLIDGYWDEDSTYQESVCFLDVDTGETKGILVGPRPHRRRAVPVLQDEDLVLLTMSEVGEVVPMFESIPRVAVVAADATTLSSVSRDTLKRLALSGRLEYVFGRVDELEALGFLTASADSMEVAEWLADCEVVATDSSAPVRVSVSKDQRATHLLPTRSLGRARKSLLGAGDAYAGAYLIGRITGKSVEEAHLAGQLEARQASYSSTARRQQEVDLTAAFGTYINRSSPDSDWWMLDRLRLGCGLSVISCGNSGVDTAGLQAALRLGLGASAVMPKGFRNDVHGEGHIPEGNAWNTYQLGVGSFRYTTWANVFLSDGTLLLDVAGGEGSAETRRACGVLSRPLMELSTESPPSRERIQAFIRQHGIRVLNVAGSRGVSLDERSLIEVQDVIDGAVWNAASAWSRPGSALTRLSAQGQRLIPKEEGALRLGAPNIPEERTLLSRWFIGSGELGHLYVGHDNLDVIFGKSVDVLHFLEQGRLDLALVGKDIVLEHGLKTALLLGETSLFNCLVGVVEREFSLPFESVCSQYPALTRNHVRGRSVVVEAIAGASEGWVESGVFDAAVDTWRTGATAARHGLAMSEVLHSTSLCLLAREGISESALATGVKLWAYLTNSLPPSS